MRRGLVLIGLAAVSWGTTGSVSTILVARTGIGPFTIGALRMWVAALVLVALTRLGGVAGPLTARDLARCAAMGVCMALFQVTFFTAVTLVGVALPALVAICSAPMLIVILAALTLGERLTVRSMLALAIGVAGAGLLVAGPPAVAATPGAFAVGSALAFAAGLSYGLYVVIAKASLWHSAPLPLTAATFTMAALVLTPALWFARDLPRELALGWPLLLYLGAVATGGAYALYTLGLRHVPAGVAGIVTLLEPLTATLLGVIAFGERLGWTGAAGAALLFASIGILATARERR